MGTLRGPLAQEDVGEDSVEDEISNTSINEESAKGSIPNGNLFSGM